MRKGISEQEEVFGKNVIGLITPENETSGKDFLKALDKLYEDPEKSSVHINENIKRDGTRVWIEWSNRALFDKDGKRIGHLAIGMDITARKLAEEDSERLKALLDNNPSLAFLKDESGRYVYLNKSYERQFALSKDWYGKTDFDFWSKESADLFRTNDTEVMKSGQMQQYLEDSTDMKGTRYCWLVHKFPFSDSSNKRYLGGIGIDVTCRVLAEEALQESEEKYRELIETSNSIVMRVDKDLKICFMNDFGLKFFGYTAKELIGKNVIGTTIPAKDDEGQDLGAMAKEITKHPEEYQINVHQNMRKTGELVWVSWTNRVQYDKDGKIAGILAIGNDISNLKKAEDTLRENERRLKIALKISHSLAFEWDPISDKVIRSESGGLILRLSKEEAINDTGKNYFQRVHPADRERFANLLKSLKPGTDSYQIEYRIVRGDGTIAMLEEIGQTSFDARGRLVRLTGSTTDITIRKEAEDVLRRDKDTFEKLVRQRTKELIEVQLELEKAKRLSDIGTLAATVAHELRNPLAAIDMASHNIKRKADDPGLNKHLATIEKKVDESDQIISNLLFYSRLKPPQYEAVKVYKELAESIKTAKIRMSSGASIDVKADAIKETVIEGDPLQLREVFTNILINAGDAVRHLDGGGKIEVSTKANKEAVIICIRDNGEGMNQETLRKAMEPFFTMKSKGTGLGLTVSKQIVEMHNGTIKLKSQPGKGTSVFIHLPKKKGGGVLKDLPKNF